MKNKGTLTIFYYLVLLVVASCTVSNTTQSPNLTVLPKKKLDTLPIVQIKPIELPETKSAKYKTQSKSEEQHKPDKYGRRLKDNTELPDFDINNRPISVWFLKDENNQYVGFIVAGHATKAVCQVASLEVHNKLKEIGENKSSIFSFGVGYNLFDGKGDKTVYHNVLQSMKEEFQQLASENRKEVVVADIDDKEGVILI